MGAASAFPSPDEHAAAAALLLLIGAPPLSAALALSCFDEIHGVRKEDLSSFMSDSSSSSSVTGITCRSQIQSDPLRILASAAFLHGIKSKVVKKARSKINYNKRAVEEKQLSEISSLSSSASSTAASARHRVWKEIPPSSRTWWCSTVLIRRARSIVRFLSAGSASEFRIRAALGDNPDTSKALRLLLKLEEVKRSGRGGRRDPFRYAVCP